MSTFLRRLFGIMLVLAVLNVFVWSVLIETFPAQDTDTLRTGGSAFFLFAPIAGFFLFWQYPATIVVNLFLGLIDIARTSLPFSGLPFDILLTALAFTGVWYLWDMKSPPRDDTTGVVL